MSMYLPLEDAETPQTSGPSIRVTYVGQEPEWLPGVADRLAHLLGLGKNWDSYGAHPVEPDIAAQALRLLHLVMSPETPVPFLVPTPLGGISMEWHRDDIELELRLDPDHSPLASLCRERDDEEMDWYVVSGSAMSALTRALRNSSNV